MFKKKNKMLLTGAVLAVMGSMNMAHANCIDDLTDSSSFGDAVACGALLQTQNGASLEDAVRLAEAIASHDATSKDAALLLAGDPTNPKTLLAKKYFNDLIKNPSLDSTLKTQAIKSLAEVIADNFDITAVQLTSTSAPIIQVLLASAYALDKETVIATFKASDGSGGGGASTGDLAKTFFDADNANNAPFIKEAKKQSDEQAAASSISGTIVQLNMPNGLPKISRSALGQALVFPYYTTRDNKKTIINIFNTSDRTVAAKVRFHESHNSRDVLDFTVILSPYDKWAGSIKEGDNGPIFVTSDTTCTVPAIPAAGIRLNDYAYNNAVVGDVGEDQTVDRLREGYIEVIAMGNAAEASMDTNLLKGIGGNAGPILDDDIKSITLATGETGNVAYYAKHIKDGDNTKPRDCSKVVKSFIANASAQDPKNNGETGSPPAANQFRPLLPGTNPLRGALTILSTENGVGFGTSALAIADFNNSHNLISAQNAPFFHEPSLASRDGLWTTTGLNAVEAAISAKVVINEWANNPINGANTDWIIQFPTKAFHVDIPYANKSALTGCDDENYQAARNKYRGNLDCNVVSSVSATNAIKKAQAELDTKESALKTAKADLNTAITNFNKSINTDAEVEMKAKMDVAITTQASSQVAVNLAKVALAAIVVGDVNSTKSQTAFGSFEKRFGPQGSPVSISTLVIDKEENQDTTEGGVSFSPARSGSTPSIPWESNVITFSGTNGVSVMSANHGDGGAIAELQLSPTSSGNLTETNGMAQLTFPKAKNGLPVVGFVAKERNQGDSSLSFGQIMKHSYK